jgi:hypothetical protein
MTFVLAFLFAGLRKGCLGEILEQAEISKISRGRRVTLHIFRGLVSESHCTSSAGASVGVLCTSSVGQRQVLLHLFHQGQRQILLVHSKKSTAARVLIRISRECSSQEECLYPEASEESTRQCQENCQLIRITTLTGKCYSLNFMHNRDSVMRRMPTFFERGGRNER